MKPLQFITFYTLITIVFTLINLYIFSRTQALLQADSSFKRIYPWIFWITASTFILGRLLQGMELGFVTQALSWIGSFWLAFMLYLFLFAVISDFIRLVLAFLPYNFATLFQKNFIFSGLYILVASLVIGGHINASRPVVKKLEIKINKPTSSLKELKVAVISDLHLGHLIGKRYLNKVIELTRSQNPDILLLAGDIVDEDIKPVLKNDLGKVLEQIDTRYGIYAITGNHEYIGGAEDAVEYLERHKVTFIRDSSLWIAGNFYLAGRNDRDGKRFGGKDRKSLDEVFAHTDFGYPVILMDHQPFHLNQTAQYDVDLSVSGHTHHGQMWPLNYITQAIFELSRGYKQIENTHFYVSCGAGTWGPRVRIGNRPEVVIINIKNN